MFKKLMPTMLNRKAEKANWQEILNILGNLNGKVIGDIGSGGGFFTLKFSYGVGDSGTVYAIDNDKIKLEFVETFVRKNGQNNVKTVYSSDHKIPLNLNSVDIFFSRNSFHHILEPVKYFNDLKSLIKQKGRIAIIDYKKTGKFNFINLFGHYSPEHDIVTALGKAGYRHLSSYNIAKDQSFNIFEKD